MNLLSLFDGMSCGQIALKELGFKVSKYYASEIDKFAIQQTQHNFPNTIQLGSVVDVDVSKLDRINLLVGGSPCQSFSFAGKQKGMSTKCEREILTLEQYLELKEEGFEFEGQSYLFWEYMRILTDIRKYNPDVLFLLENVEMSKKWERTLSEAIGVFGVHINSALVSAQSRKRIYWTNIKTRQEGFFNELHSDIPQPEDRGILLKDILEDEVDEKYYLSDKMLNFFTANSKKMKEKGNGFKFEPTYGERKGKSLTTLNGSRMDDNFIITHNLQPRQGKGIGGKGHLQKEDGKSYCVDTGNGQAVEIQGCDYRKDEGLRMKKDGKSGTLCARARTDESCGQMVSDNVRIRRLTPTECARLQTIPDWYRWIVSSSQQYKMLGNGWTVEVIKHILSFINFKN